jgi:hypothetical protein
VKRWGQEALLKLRTVVTKAHRNTADVPTKQF